MQVFDNGAFVTVVCTRRDVEVFRGQWPCNGMTDKPLTVQFDKRNGDLVDSNDSTNHPGADGSALLALIDDAKGTAWKRLDLAV